MLKNMVRPADLVPFVQQIFAEDANLVSRVLHGILQAGSPRLSDISHAMEGTSPNANNKTLNRFLNAVDPWMPLMRLFDEDAPFVVGDVTEIERPHAKRTEYVGRLKDKRRGYWMLMLGTPRGGRVIPFYATVYSSKTINSECVSRNTEHIRALEKVWKLIEDVPLVFDREFSYEGFLEQLRAKKQPFVIRLNTGSRVKFTDKSGNPVQLDISRGKVCVLKNVYYKGRIPVHLAGVWEAGCSQPLWVMTSLEDPRKGLAIYRRRMTIEESFKDLKSLLHLCKLMNKRRDRAETMIALTLIAYSLAYIIGEAAREEVCSKKNG